MFPNTRRVRSRYIWNVIDKVLLDNPVSQWTLRVIARSGLIEMGQLLWFQAIFTFSGAIAQFIRMSHAIRTSFAPRRCSITRTHILGAAYGGSH